MKLLLLILILGLIAALNLGIVVALWRYKKNRWGRSSLLGESGSANTSLDPVGSVLIAGELWPAQTSDGEHITAGTRVRVVEVQDHGVLVEPCD